MKRNVSYLSLALVTAGFVAGGLAPTPSLAHVALSPAPIGGSPQEIAHLPCEIDISDPYGNPIDDGDTLPINTLASFPLEVEMRISNTGDNDVFGVTNEYVIHHQVRTSPPMPLISETLDIPAGTSTSRTFFVDPSMLVATGDHISVTVSPDVDGDYLSAGPFPTLPRQCRSRVDFEVYVAQPPY